MPAPTEKAIQLSWDNLQKGLPLLQHDFFHIAWSFAFQPERDKFLQQVLGLNKKLAETLLIFRKRLVEAAAKNQDLDSLIDRAYLHYIVNTDGQIPDSGDADPFDVLDAASRYAGPIGVSVLRKQMEAFYRGG
ncbi:MAG: hypothetical protein IPJ00_17140 [Saprospirales bacterium]|nr:hypothetical protein [Saprospirales bacterium]